MTTKRKKYEKIYMFFIILLCVIMCVTMVVGIFAYIKKFDNTREWISLKEIAYCENFFEETIVEISLRETVDSDVWAIFSDDDLIQEWVKYFEKATFKYTNSIDKTPSNGGRKTVSIFTNSSTFTFYFSNLDSEPKVIINGKVYTIKSDASFPFTETYTIAIERNGPKTPWD